MLNPHTCKGLQGLCVVLKGRKAKLGHDFASPTHGVE